MDSTCGAGVGWRSPKHNPPMLGLCVGLAGAVWVELPLSRFTLAWRHSVEKVRWEEDYRITAEGLVLEQARIKGSGAGMEIPDDAALRNGRWHYRPNLPPLDLLRLGRTPEAGDYQICFDQRCHALSEWLGPPVHDQAMVELWGCVVAKV